MTIWMDVTTVLAWNRPPVGIVRTELECARHVIETNEPSRLSLCYYNKNADEFCRLTKDQHTKVLHLLGGAFSGIGVLPPYSDAIKSVATIEDNGTKDWRQLLFGSDQFVYTVDPVQNECIRGWIFERKRPQRRVTIELRSEGRFLCMTVAEKFRQDLLDAGMSDGYCSFEVPIRDALERLGDSKDTTIQIFAQGKKQRLIGHIDIDSDALALFPSPDTVPTGGEILKLGREDVYITAGLDWENKDFQKIYSKKKSYGFRIVGFCYDLIPVKFPHWCVGDVASFFSSYFVDLSWCADHILCISERSRADYQEFAAEAGCPVVETSVVRLGSDLKSCRDDAGISLEVQDLLQSKYLLFVSTVERRKNHEVLYRAYTRLVDKGVAALPKLIFVGMRGWGVSELFTDISLDPRTKGLIQAMDRVSDEELALLYQHALFTVFPSLYEGWGLPVAESLAYGKYCLASNQGSIPEIARDLLDYIDPWSVQAWADQIEALIGNPKLLAEKENRIRRKFSADSWASCVSQVFTSAAATLAPIEDIRNVDPKANLVFPRDDSVEGNIGDWSGAFYRLRALVASWNRAFPFFFPFRRGCPENRKKERNFVA